MPNSEKRPPPDPCHGLTLTGSDVPRLQSPTEQMLERLTSIEKKLDLLIAWTPRIAHSPFATPEEDLW